MMTRSGRPTPHAPSVSLSSYKSHCFAAVAAAVLLVPALPASAISVNIVEDTATRYAFDVVWGANESSIVGNDVDVIGSNVWSVDAGSLVDTDSYWHTPSGDVADSFRVKFPSLGALPGRYDRRFSVSSLIQFDGSQALSLGVEPYGARFVYGEPYPINPPTGVPDNSASALLLSAGLAGLTLLRRTVV